MWKKVTTVFVITFAFAQNSHAVAHDAWMEPDRYTTSSGETVKIDLVIGHAGDRNRYRLASDRIVSLRHQTAEQSADIAFLFPAGGDSGAAEFNLPAGVNGYHVVGLETNNASIDLAPDAFLKHARTEGLTLAIEGMEVRAPSDGAVHEVYSRRIKTVIAVGTGDDQPLTTPIGHDLEIVFTADPFTRDVEEPVLIEVLFKGDPLPGALVDAESLSIEALGPMQATTDQDGRAAFRLAKSGAWRFAVVWTTPGRNRGADGDAADFETIFSSLTFGYD